MTSESPKPPWWVFGRSVETARNAAFLYTIIFALFGSVAIGTRGRGGGIWSVVLLILWGLLTAWGWFSFSYFVRQRQNDDRK
jgi:hypothetical protein